MTPCWTEEKSLAPRIPRVVLAVPVVAPTLAVVGNPGPASRHVERLAGAVEQDLDPVGPHCQGCPACPEGQGRHFLPPLGSASPVRSVGICILDTEPSRFAKEGVSDKSLRPDSGIPLNSKAFHAIHRSWQCKGRDWLNGLLSKSCFFGANAKRPVAARYQYC